MADRVARAALICMILVPLTGAGCGRPSAASPLQDAVAPPATAAVKLVQPARKSLKRTIEQPGHLEAFEQTPLFARIPGYVSKVAVDIGDRVKKDEVLTEIAVPELVEELEQKRAHVTLAGSEVEQARAAFKASEASLETAKALVQEAEAGRSRAVANLDRWQSESRRVQELVQRRVIDEQTRDETLSQFKAAEAGRDEVEAKVRSMAAARDESAAKRDKAAADVNARKARLQVAQADQRRVEALVAFAKIRAPFDGVVIRRHVDTGHLLQATGSSRGDPVFVVMRTDPVRVFVDVPELDAVAIVAGVAAKIRIQAFKGEEFTGKVVRSAWALDPRTHTLRTAIDLPNPEGRLRPGMYAHAVLTVERPDVWTLPATAVVGQGDQGYAWRVEDGKARKLTLRLGARDSGLVEVLKKQQTAESPWEDVAATDLVIVNPPATLAEGQSVLANP